MFSGIFFYSKGNLVTSELKKAKSKLNLLDLLLTPTKGVLGVQTGT